MKQITVNFLLEKKTRNTSKDKMRPAIYLLLLTMLLVVSTADAKKKQDDDDDDWFLGVLTHVAIGVLGKIALGLIFPPAACAC